MSKNALITGGTSGIGKATAQVLHDRGYRVAVTGSTTARIDQARRDLPNDVLILQADARSITDTDRVIDQVKEQFGGVDALFLNAGIVHPAPIAEVDENAYDDVFAVNTKAAFFTLQKALPLMADGSSIVLTVGTAVTRGSANLALTAGSRGALLAMVPSLALELAPRRIRVNAVSPGATETGLWEGATDEARQSVAARIPFGRLATAGEIASVVAFLVSEDSGFVTGENIVVSGGAGIA